MNQDSKKSGFTLVELSLAMTFVALLLVVVALTIMQIADIYNRGLVLKEVNTTGSAIISDLKRSIAESSTFDPGESSRHAYFPDKNGAVGEVYCTGTYSYIWNYGSEIVKDSQNTKLYTYNGEVVRLIKVSDVSTQYCSFDSGSKPAVIDSGNTSVEKLISSDTSTNLVVYNFSISRLFDASVNQGLYSISLKLGTSDKDTIDNGTCKTPSEASSDLTRCAINQFNATVRTGNSV